MAFSEKNPVSREGRTTPFRTTDSLVVFSSAAALFAIGGVISLQDASRRGNLHAVSESVKRSEPESCSWEELREAETRLDDLVKKCVSICNGKDADILSAAISERPLNPDKIYGALEQLSCAEVKCHFIGIVQGLRTNPCLAPTVVKCVPKHMANHSMGGMIASLAIPTNDPLWSDTQQVCSALERLLKLHEAARKKQASEQNAIAGNNK